MQKNSSFNPATSNLRLAERIEEVNEDQGRSESSSEDAADQEGDLGEEEAASPCSDSLGEPWDDDDTEEVHQASATSATHCSGI